MNRVGNNRKIETATRKGIFTSYPTKGVSIHTEYPRRESSKGEEERIDYTRSEETADPKREPDSI